MSPSGSVTSDINAGREGGGGRGAVENISTIRVHNGE